MLFILEEYNTGGGGKCRRDRWKNWIPSWAWHSCLWTSFSFKLFVFLVYLENTQCLYNIYHGSSNSKEHIVKDEMPSFRYTKKWASQNIITTGLWHITSVSGVDFASLNSEEYAYSSSLILNSRILVVCTDKQLLHFTSGMAVLQCLMKWSLCLVFT